MATKSRKIKVIEDIEIESRNTINKRYINLDSEELLIIRNKAKNYTIYDIYEWYVCESTGEMILMSEFVKLNEEYNKSVKKITKAKYDKTINFYINLKRVDIKYSNKIDIYEFDKLCFEQAYKDYFLEKINTDNLIKLMYHE